MILTRPKSFYRRSNWIVTQICICSAAPMHTVEPKGKYIAFVSAEAKTDNPEVELKPGVYLLGPVDEIFYNTYDRFTPTNNSEDDHCFISTSYDATTHFESTVADVLAIYSKITGKAVDPSVDMSAASANAQE
ncbi:Guanosine nucleotide diphosphate dissociation inhibitor [Forsythia ovata]|uniref:Guanosine nucleotide diphosphate dissociation inhibitor n=1 Tax=Forsythia ovata TaxID=205694 RepID=A0ABD1VIJ3_9LAMI